MTPWVMEGFPEGKAEHSRNGRPGAPEASRATRPP
jgi:hypothetical protein